MDDGGWRRPRYQPAPCTRRRPVRGGWGVWVAVAILATSVSGCATMRHRATSEDLRPCLDGYAVTEDGWRLGVRHLRPERPDPTKLPVVLCHGLGLNATFWTISGKHLPSQLLDRGYEVFLFDFRGSGESTRVGTLGQINGHLRQTFLLEMGEGGWTVDDIVRYDVPAVLDYVKAATGKDRVNWVGHSLGGMLMFPYLEDSPGAPRVENLVAMGATITLSKVPQTDMLSANRSLRTLASVVSPGRLGRPLMLARLPGLDQIDRFYYTQTNVDRSTVSRFYGYALEDTGRGALKQLDPYLEYGHFVSADGRVDYAARLGRVKTPTLMVAGDGDIMSDVPSTELTLQALGSADKALLRFGKAEGNVADYGHCDLVWSRYAPEEIFPPLIDWLDRRQPPLPSAQSPVPSPQSGPSPSYLPPHGGGPAGTSASR